MMKRWINETIDEYLTRADESIAHRISEAILCNAFGYEEKKAVIAEEEQLQFLKKNPWLFSLVPLQEVDEPLTPATDTPF